MTQLIEDYFSAFCAQNLEKLSELYADTIMLNEWNTNIFVGKEKVLEANKQLFNQFKNIRIETITSLTDEHHRVSINEIVVKLDNQKVRVIDVIRFNPDGKINNITAYRGF
jgi:hypothetical protein